VADNPLSLVNLSSNDVSGILEIPLTVSNLELEDAAGFDLMLIGRSETGTSLAWNAATRIELDEDTQRVIWHTAYDPNGTSPLQIRLSSIETGQTVFGPLHQVTIDNSIQVLDSLHSFGTQLAFDAQSKEPNGKYRVWFYDQNGNPLTYETNSATVHFSIGGDVNDEGGISFTWDLNLPDGSSYSGERVVATARTSPADIPYTEDPCSPGSLCPPFIWARETNWVNNDKFITFFARLLPQEETDLPQRYFTLLAANEPLMREDISGTGQPYGLNPESGWIQTWGFPSASQLREWTWKMTGANRTNVLERMAEPEYRNLFYNGHGDTDGIMNYAGEGIYSREIRKKLGNQAQHFQGNQHPYRLVFMYACCTGRGSMCRAFGIPREVLTVADFDKRGVRARAFIGSRDTATIPTFDAYGAAGIEAVYLARFFEKWRTGLIPLSQILAEAKQIVNGNVIVRNGIVGDYVIFGATDLQRGSTP
jgi:hypothetical protein